MAVVRKFSNAKRGRAIPIKVTIDPRPAPTTRPPLPPIAVAPKPTPTSVIKIQRPDEPKPRKIFSQSVHEWPEEKRRRLMWWLVGGGTVVVIIGWLAVVRFELRGTQGPDLFSETMRLLKTIRWLGTEPAQSTAEKEIRQLDKEVFPKLTQ